MPTTSLPPSPTKAACRANAFGTSSKCSITPSERTRSKVPRLNSSEKRSASTISPSTPPAARFSRDSSTPLRLDSSPVTAARKRSAYQSSHLAEGAPDLENARARSHRSEFLERSCEATVEREFGIRTCGDRDPAVVLLFPEVLRREVGRPLHCRRAQTRAAPELQWTSWPRRSPSGSRP